MDFSKHIEQLLYKNDCVILPNIGGFVLRYESASIDFLEQQLHPPCKKVSFNTRLNQNDGLLCKYIAEQEVITYSQAQDLVEQFSIEVESALFENKYYNFHKIGRLHFDEQLKIEFTPAATNFSSNAFGFPIIDCIPILREKENIKFDEAVSTKAIVQKKRSTTRKKISSKVWTAAAIFLLCIAGTWLFELNRSKNSLLVQKAPTATTKGASNTLKSNQTASLLPSLVLSPVETVSVAKAAKPRIEKKAAPVPIKKTKVLKQKTYTVILGAFGKEKNAERLALKLANEGYLPDVALKKNKLYRVAVLITCGKKEFSEHLSYIQKNFNKKAWVAK